MAIISFREEMKADLPFIEPCKLNPSLIKTEILQKKKTKKNWVYEKQ